MLVFWACGGLFVLSTFIFVAVWMCGCSLAFSMAYVCVETLGVWFAACLF